MPDLAPSGEPAVLTQEAARRMSRADFLAWAETQPARYERVDGRVVRMNAERGAHVRMKGALFIALREAARASGAACQVLTDGATVATGDCDYEPDATVNLGEPMGAQALIVPNPVIVAEVLSPASEAVDTGRKLVDYFRLPSIEHYLIVDPLRPLIVWHRRADATRLETLICAAGPIAMAPPGLTISVERVWELATE